MANGNLIVKVKMAWWFKPYLYGIATMAAITGAEPDWDRVNYWVKRAMKLKFTAAK